jgi:hypothetical protein
MAWRVAGLGTECPMKIGPVHISLAALLIIVILVILLA